MTMAEDTTRDPTLSLLLFLAAHCLKLHLFEKALIYAKAAWILDQTNILAIEMYGYALLCNLQHEECSTLTASAGDFTSDNLEYLRARLHLLDGNSEQAKTHLLKYLDLRIRPVNAHIPS